MSAWPPASWRRDWTLEGRAAALLQAGCEALGADVGALACIDGGVAEIIAICGAAPEGAPPRLENSLAGLIGAECRLLRENRLSRSPWAGRRDLSSRRPGAVLAAPLMLDGALYGVVEFTCASARTPWTEDDLEMATMICMFLAAQLEQQTQIRMLRRSEAALLAEATELRRGRVSCAGEGA